MTNAASTAGTLMNRKNWSTESIVVSPKTKAPSPAALLHPLGDVLVGWQRSIGNRGSTHGEARQNRNHDAASIGSTPGQTLAGFTAAGA